MEQFTASMSSLARPVRGRPVTQEMRGAAVGLHQGTKQKLSREEISAQRAQGVSGAMNFAWGMQLFLVPAFLARKMGMTKLSGHFRALGHMIIDPLMDTKLGDIFRLPGNVGQVAADHYSITGHSAKRVDGIRRNAQAIDRAMLKGQAATLEPLGRMADRGLEKVAGNKSGGFMSRQLERFANMRHKVNLRKSDGSAILGTLEKATKEHPDIFSGFSFEHVKDMDATARVSHFADASKTFREIFDHTGHNLSVRTHALELSREAGKLARDAEAAVAHGAAGGQGLTGLVRNVGRMGARTPVIMGMMAVGAVAASAAAVFTMRHANNVGAAALRDMEADLGDPKSPYLQQVKQSYTKGKRGRAMQTGLTAVGETAMAASMGTINVGGGSGLAAITGGGGGMPLMMVGMGAPMLGQALVKENLVLNAYANLQQAEKGTLQVPEAEKIAQVRQLVGAVPAVQPHGGYYNKLCQPIAAKIVADKLSLHDTMRLLGDPAKFTAYAAEVKKAQPAAHGAAALKTKGLGSADHTHPQAEDFQEQADFKDQADRTAAHTAHRQKAASANDNLQAANDHGPMIDAPGTKVQAAEAEHDGMLAEQQLAQGKQN